MPKPSQLDDWALYQKLEGDKIKLLQGESSYLQWKLEQRKEKVERDEWQRARLFKASFARAVARNEQLGRRATGQY